MVVSRPAVALALAGAGWGEATPEVEASLRGVAGGGHQAPPLGAVRAGPADAVLLADGGVGGFVHQDGLEAGRGHGVGA